MYLFIYLYVYLYLFYLFVYLYLSKRGMRLQSGHRAQHQSRRKDRWARMEGSRSTIWPILVAREQRRETLISVPSFIKISYCKIQRALGKSGDRMSFLGVSGGRIRQCWAFKNIVGRRWFMTLMYKVIVSRIHTTLTGSGGQIAFVRGSCGNVGATLCVQEHHRETLISDIYV